MYNSWLIRLMDAATTPKQKLKRFIKRITRRKPIIPNAPSPLERVCNIWDLLAVAIGGTLGIGIFVLPGEVARKYAGPAVIISVTIAAFATFIGCKYIFLRLTMRIYSRMHLK